MAAITSGPRGVLGANRFRAKSSRSAPRIVTADTTLTPNDSGAFIIINAAATRVITLPSAVTLGLVFTFAQQVASTSGVGHTVHPVGTDVMRGNGFTPAAAKGAVNTEATARIGDTIRVVSDGVGAWYIEYLTGAWAREA